MNFYTTYGAYLKSLDTVDSVFFEIVKTPVFFSSSGLVFSLASSTPSWSALSSFIRFDFLEQHWLIFWSIFEDLSCFLPSLVDLP